MASSIVEQCKCRTTLISSYPISGRIWNMSLACYLVQGLRVFLASEGPTLVDSFDAPGSLYPNHAHSSTPVTIVSFWTLAFPCGPEIGCGPVAWKKKQGTRPTPQGKTRSTGAQNTRDTHGLPRAAFSRLKEANTPRHSDQQVGGPSQAVKSLIVVRSTSPSPPNPSLRPSLVAVAVLVGTLDVGSTSLGPFYAHTKGYDGPPLKIIVTGKPSSGKGSISPMVSRAYRGVYIASGNLLRSEVCYGRATIQYALSSASCCFSFRSDCDAVRSRFSWLDRLDCIYGSTIPDDPTLSQPSPIHHGNQSSR